MGDALAGGVARRETALRRRRPVTPGRIGSAVWTGAPPFTEYVDASPGVAVTCEPVSMCTNTVPGRQLDSLSQAPPRRTRRARPDRAAAVGRTRGGCAHLVAPRGSVRRVGKRLAARRQQDDRGAQQNGGGTRGDPEPRLLRERLLLVGGGAGRVSIGTFVSVAGGGAAGSGAAGAASPPAGASRARRRGRRRRGVARRNRRGRAGAGATPGVAIATGGRSSSIAVFSDASGARVPALVPSG